MKGRASYRAPYGDSSHVSHVGSHVPDLCDLGKRVMQRTCAQGGGETESPLDPDPGQQVETESCQSSSGHQGGTKECQNSVKTVSKECQKSHVGAKARPQRS